MQLTKFVAKSLKKLKKRNSKLVAAVDRHIHQIVRNPDYGEKLVNPKLRGRYTVHIMNLRLVYCYSDYCKQSDISDDMNCSNKKDTIIIRSLHNVKKKYEELDFI